MKKILIMGANPETVSLVEKAKEMGYYTIVTDYDPDAYAKRYADKAANVDAVDVDGLVELAKKEQVSGVVVGVAEALLPAYCDVCERLGFPAYSTKEVFSVMTRKDLFKKKCREYGVPTIREYSYDDPESISYPVVVKPVDNCSSKGIRVVRNRAELDEAVPYALSFSSSGKYLIEEYMTGDEVISYYVMQDGNPVFAGMCDRYTYKGQGELVQLPTCYIYPSRYTESYMKTADAAARNLIRGLGLKNGSIFFQCFVDSGGTVRVYEPGYRLNGAQEHILLSRMTGIDAKELYINYAVSGRVADIDLSTLENPHPKQFGCKLSPLVRTGKISKLEGLDRISKLPGVASIRPSYRDGDTVTGEGTLKQIVCRFFIISDSKDAMAQTVRDIESEFSVRGENGEEMLIAQFDPERIDRLYE